MPDAESFLPLSEATLHILLALAAADCHGYAIMRDVQTHTGGAIKLNPGTLYTSIRRLLQNKLIIEIDERPESDDERRRYYRITEFGREVLSAEMSRFTRLLSQARSFGVAPQKR